jgi:hypothetical protein
MAKMSTSGQRASWASSTLSRFDLPEPRSPTTSDAISRSDTEQTWPSSYRPIGIGALMLSVSWSAGSGTVSASTSRSATCSSTWWAWSPRSKRRLPWRSRAATSSRSMVGASAE